MNLIPSARSKKHDKPTQTSILLADDSPVVRKALAAILQSQGFTVRDVENGREALEALDNGRRPQLIITDLSMPHLDGFALLEALGKSATHGAIPKIVYTSIVGTTDRLRALNLGADAYIVKKPGSERELLRTVLSFVSAFNEA